jgi:O-antigen ligase
MNKPVITVKRFQEGSLCVLLFLLPFSKAAIEIGFGLLLLGWVLERVDSRTRGDTVWRRASFRPLALALAGFLGVCALSILGSRHLPESLSGLINKWAEYLLFFVIAADLGARPGVVRRVAWVFAASSVFVVVEALSQELFGTGIFRGYRWIVYQRMTGPYENPIDLATYLMVAIPLLLGLAAVQPRRPARAVLWTLIAILLACFGRTLAFGAWLSFLAAFALLVWRRTPLRRQAALTVLAALLAAGFFVARRGEWRIVSLSDVGTQDRIYMWQTALRMIHDRPMLGHGINTFMANYLDYWVGGERMPRYAHNCYLQMAAETGLVGLAAFLWLLWRVFARMWRALRAAGGSRERALLAGLAAGLLAFVIQSAYDTNFYAMRQVALFFVLAGLAVGLSASPTNAKS